MQLKIMKKLNIKQIGGYHPKTEDHAASAPNPTRANPKNEMMQMK